VEIYQSSAAADFFDINKCEIRFNDISGKYAKNSLTKEDFSSSVPMKKGDQGVVVMLRREE
jgi:hypothetical protein